MLPCRECRLSNLNSLMATSDVWTKMTFPESQALHVVGVSLSELLTSQLISRQSFVHLAPTMREENWLFTVE